MDFSRLVEEKIRDAIDAGMFDNLAGKGAPLTDLEDSSGDDWMGLHILRSNGFLPEWLELRKQVAARRAAVQGALDAWRAAVARYGDVGHVLARAAHAEYLRQAASINALIDLHNLRCPSIHLEIARFREDAPPR